jgi:hypothetical protein
LWVKVFGEQNNCSPLPREPWHQLSFPQMSQPLPFFVPPTGASHLKSDLGGVPTCRWQGSTQLGVRVRRGVEAPGDGHKSLKYPEPESKGRP